MSLQAEVQGQKITWLTPHALQQVLTDDIDFNVMLTYLEFHEVASSIVALVFFLVFTELISFMGLLSWIFQILISYLHSFAQIDLQCSSCC